MRLDEKRLILERLERRHTFYRFCQVDNMLLAILPLDAQMKIRQRFNLFDA